MVCVVISKSMVYVFDSSCAAEALDQVLDWQWRNPRIEMWRGRSDRPGQYRFDWRIRVEGTDETLFLVLFSGVLEFSAEPDYLEPIPA